MIKEVLEETYGLIVFQEQIMKLCSVVAGFPEEETDTVRRSIMKRKASEAAESLAKARSIKEQFVAGSVKNGVDRQLADDLYEKILFFAGYGFNKSHSAAYAMLTYHTGYLKAHYPAAFFAAMLTSDSNKTDKVVRYVFEARRMGMKVLPPDVNESDKDFSITSQGIRFGLGAVKGIGEAAIDAIIESRKEYGHFTNL